MNNLLRSILVGSSLALVACGGGSAQSTETRHGEGGMHCSGGEHDCMHHGEHAEAVAPPSGPVVAPGEAHVGDTTTCPVSGERFVVTDQSPHSDYEGHTYYFCCPGCIERFQANPAQFAHPAAGGEREAQPG